MRMIVLGIISTPIFLYGGTYFAPMITKLAVQTGSFKVPAGQQLSWSTIEGPDFRLFFGQALAGQWWAVVAAVIWTVLFIWLYKDQQKIALPSKRYATLAGVTPTSTVAPKASANYQDIDLNALDGMHIGGKKKVNDYQNIDLNALDGMNFSQKKKVK